jgi:hypothetical protein
VSATASEQQDEHEPNWKAWRVLGEFIVAWVVLMVAIWATQQLPNLPPWFALVNAGLFFICGCLFLLHGVDCIRWRRPVAEFWAAVPPSSWLLKDPVGHHTRQVASFGVMSVLGGCVVVLAAVGIAVKSLNG